MKFRVDWESGILLAGVMAMVFATGVVSTLPSTAQENQDAPIDSDSYNEDYEPQDYPPYDDPSIPDPPDPNDPHYDDYPEDYLDDLYIYYWLYYSEYEYDSEGNHYPDIYTNPEIWNTMQ